MLLNECLVFVAKSAVYDVRADVNINFSSIHCEFQANFVERLCCNGVSIFSVYLCEINGEASV